MKTYTRTVKNTFQKGAAVLIVVLFFVILSVTLLIGVSMPVAQQIENATDFLASKKTYNVADIQAENTLYRFNKGRSDAPSTLSILGAEASGNITDVGDEKQISIQGLSQDFERFIKAQFKQDIGVAFNYGLQTGVGGLQMNGGSTRVVGNIYSNGDVSGSGSITGSVTAATLSNPVAQIENLASTTPSHTFNIGQTNTNQDFAQSFIAGTTSPVTEIQFYMKKTLTPANATVKIVNNNSGVPGSTVLTSGTLSSSLVTSLYAYVPVTMTTSVSLVLGTTYWIVIDTASNNATNYYTLGMNNAIYSGNTKQGRLGTSWTNLATTTLDVGFRVLVGGDPGIISGVTIGTGGVGDAWAKTVTGATVAGTIFCQNGTGNNKACDTSKVDPVASPMPVSSGNIDEWKEAALAGGATTSASLGSGDITVGPKKIIGDLELDGNDRLNITGTIHVTGDINISGTADMYADTSLGTEVGIIIVDGKVDLGGSGGIYGSGSPGSYVLVVSTSQCPIGPSCGGASAVTLGGSGGSVILTALDGTVTINGSSEVKSVVAKTMVMNGSSDIVYDTGLASLDFSSGPSGSWTVSSWKEALGL
jgi:cytoskeletal protein CcmA (bactofilin family)